jgi:quercetin dioxygenase-like cupin family protein
MRLVRFAAENARPIEAHGSSGFSISPLASSLGASFQAVVRLQPGGRIGRHPTVGPQMLAIVVGSGTVSGRDGVEHAVGVGDAAVWDAGEEHETRTDEGLTAIVIEGGGLEILAGP